MPQTEIAFNLLAHLKQKAEACDPKIWHLNDGDIYAETPTVPMRIAEVEFAEDAEFIAAACPAMVLAMIAEIERLRVYENYYIIDEDRPESEAAGE